jgi:cell division protein FtsB
MKAMTAGLLRPRLGPGAQVIVVVLIVGMFGALAIEPTRQLLQQRDRLSGMSQDLKSVERSNEKLEDRIDKLKNPDFLEQRARTLGLVRSGETTYIVMPPGKSAKKGRRGAADRVQEPPPEPGFVEAFMQFIGIP